MEDEVDGTGSLQFDWLPMNFVVRDGVTLYEVHLDDALHEVASRVGATVIGEKSPPRSKLDSAIHWRH